MYPPRNPYEMALICHKPPHAGKKTSIQQPADDVMLVMAVPNNCTTNNVQCT